MRRGVAMAAAMLVCVSLAPGSLAQERAPGLRPDPEPLISGAQLDAARQRLGDLPATLVVADALDRRVVVRLDRAAAGVPAPPCSTFKIPNALLSLEEGAVSVGDHAIPRDRAVIPDGDWRANGRWAEDQDLLSALRWSTVWYFQELARRVGEEAMAEWLATFDYGNQDLSGGLTTFWLGSSLRISAEEQVEFVSRLVRGELPVAKQHVALLKRGILRDHGLDLEAPDGPFAWFWYGKTGACQNPPYEDVVRDESYGDLPEDTPWVGWLVGWVERSDRGPLVYAFRVEAESYAQLQERRDPLIRPLLTDLGLLPELTSDE